MSDIDHEHTQEIVCPGCCHIQSDSWEWGNGEGDFDGECGECEMTFRWSRHVSITYSTSKIEPEQPKPEIKLC
jgi:hypothetical protein